MKQMALLKDENVNIFKQKLQPMRQEIISKNSK